VDGTEFDRAAQLAVCGVAQPVVEKDLAKCSVEYFECPRAEELDLATEYRLLTYGLEHQM